MDSVNLPSLPGPVVEYLEANCSDGEQSAQLSVMPTQHKFWHRDRMIECSNLSRYGLTCEVLTESLGEELLMSYLADSRVRTSASRVKVPVSMGKNQDYGSTWHALSMKFDRDSCTWKIHHSLFPEDLSESLVILPKWGSMRNGELWERATSALLTSVTGAGSLPTPTASMMTIQDFVQAKFHSSKRPDYKNVWQTPTVQDANGRDRHKQRDGSVRLSLLGQVKQTDGGALNPDWVEWLMNWPMGWTSLEPMRHESWKHWKESSAADFHSDGVREMWYDRDPSTPSQGQESTEQLPVECGDPLPKMPQGGSHAGWDMGARKSGAVSLQSVRTGIPAEAHAAGCDMQQTLSIGVGAYQCREKMEYVPRVATGVIARIERLKAIGNGQVPEVAARAWNLLSPDNEQNN